MSEDIIAANNAAKLSGENFEKQQDAARFYSINNAIRAGQLNNEKGEFDQKKGDALIKQLKLFRYGKRATYDKKENAYLISEITEQEKAKFEAEDQAEVEKEKAKVAVSQSTLSEMPKNPLL